MNYRSAGHLLAAFCEGVTRKYPLFLGGLEASIERNRYESKTVLRLTLGGIKVSRELCSSDDLGASDILWEALDELLSQVRHSWFPA